jgi:hypothetical protein
MQAYTVSQSFLKLRNLYFKKLCAAMSGSTQSVKEKMAECESKQSDGTEYEAVLEKLLARIE